MGPDERRTDELPENETGWALPGAAPDGPPPLLPPEPAATEPPGADVVGDPGDKPPTSEVAIAALVCGICALPPLAIGLGIAALVRIDRTGQRGRGQAITGLVAAALWTMIFLGAVSFSFDTGGVAPEEAAAQAARVKVGDCIEKFAPFETGKPDTGEKKLVDCSAPHAVQVVAVFEGSPGDDPGPAERLELAASGCGSRVGLVFFKSPEALSRELTLAHVAPAEVTWKGGSRRYFCFVGSRKGPLTGPIDLSAPTDPHLKAWLELTRGDCVKEDPEQLRARVVTTVSCRGAHGMQVVHSFNPPPGPWRGQEETRAAAMQECVTHTGDVALTPDLRERLQMTALVPDQAAWTIGLRTAACIIYIPQGTLPARSLLKP